MSLIARALLALCARALSVSFFIFASASLPSSTRMLPTMVSTALLCCSSCCFSIAALSCRPCEGGRRAELGGEGFEVECAKKLAVHSLMCR
jgi:hypothetical protein